MREHHRPSQPGDAFFDAVEGGPDPALAREAGDLAATLLVRGAGDGEDAEVAERIVHLAETEGLETLADVWSGAPADTLAGCLWRLYVLRDWVHRAPAQVAREYDAGRGRAPHVARVVAGVADPPGPEQLKTMVDEVLRGIAGGDFAVTLLRAASFARVVAAGRAVLESDHLADDHADDPAHGDADHRATSRLLGLAEQLERAGHSELAGRLA